MVANLLFRADDLQNYMVDFFRKLGVPHEDARRSAEILLAADLHGINSHGIIRLFTYYGKRLKNKQMQPVTQITIKNETPATLAIDAGNGMGQVAGFYTMQRSIEKAQTSGVCFATVSNSNHYGIAGYYAKMAIANDMIGMSFTNSQPLVAPTFGKTAILGTNPIAVAAPAGNERPYILDMATSIVPLGKVAVYDKAAEPIPEGWGVDNKGNMTTTPAEVINGGALMPLGGPEIMRGYKGYGLGLMVDIFSGILAGAAFGPHVARPRTSDDTANVGHFFAAINISFFRDVAEFKSDMDEMIQILKNAPKAENEPRIFIHGEKEIEKSEKYLKEGIPLMETVVESLKEAGNEIGVPFNLQPITI
ncbi:MAG: Ldh family oxidoreductase [Anaerolineaceae bacterium]|nr:Ldh family oxidoreductase [Anaerolineaceae bacterium]